MIIGWSLGGLIGPPIIAALIGDDKSYTTGYTVIGIIALVSLVLPVTTKMPKPMTPAEQEVAPGTDADLVDEAPLE